MNGSRKRASAILKATRRRLFVSQPEPHVPRGTLRRCADCGAPAHEEWNARPERIGGMFHVEHSASISLGGIGGASGRYGTCGMRGKFHVEPLARAAGMACFIRPGFLHLDASDGVGSPLSQVDHAAKLNKGEMKALHRVFHVEHFLGPGD